MRTGDEVESPTIARPTPPPRPVGEIVLPRAPTPDSILRCIAAADGEPWFPSKYAADTGLDRDSLDEPLNVLRLAGLVSVGDWVRGTGQGYVLTPQGRDAAATGIGIPSAGTTQAELAAAAAAPAAPSIGPTSGLVEPHTTAKLGLDPRPPFVVPILLIANVLCFFVGLAGAVRGGYPLGTYIVRGHSHVLHRLGAVTGEDLLRGDWWRLFTSCFVHIGVPHLVMNLITLAVMGLLAELLWGRWRLAVIYLVSGLAGSCLGMANQPGAMLAGASGAIWGLLTSQVAWLLLFRRDLPPDVARDWQRKLWVLFVLNAGVSLLPGVSWEAHLGGGVAGFLTALLLNVIRYKTGWRRVLAVALLAALPVACLGGLAAAIKWGGQWEGLRQRFAARQEQEARLAQQARFDAAVDAAVQEFLRGARPDLDKLRPEVIVPVEEQARHEELDKFQMWRVGEKRQSARAAVVAKLTEFRTAADSLAARAGGPASGIEDFDRYRARVRAFAEARSKSLGLLLAQLAAEGKPDPAAWAQWNATRLTANLLWQTVAHP